MPLINLNEVLKQLRAEAALSYKTLWLAKNSSDIIQAAFLMEPLEPGEALVEEPIRCWDVVDGDVFRTLEEFQPWVSKTLGGNFQPDGDVPSRCSLTIEDPRLKRRT
jgi:hypothetical protein